MFFFLVPNFLTVTQVLRVTWLRLLSDILAPLVGNTAQHVKNSQHLAEEVAEILIEIDENFLSHDVVSLFTNIPIQKALVIVRSRLNADPTLKDRTKLSVDDIMELLEFILTTTYMTFRGQIYNQKFGTAMGSPVSPIIANLVMENLEQQAVAAEASKFRGGHIVRGSKVTNPQRVVRKKPRVARENFRLINVICTMIEVNLFF